MSKKVPKHELHRVVATCIVHTEDRHFLIGLRPPDVAIFPNKWGVPGGGISQQDYANLPKSLPDGWNDPIGIGLRREILQEMGIQVGPLTYLGNFSHIRPDGVAVIGLRFAAPYGSGDVVLKLDEFIEHKWVRAGELSQYDLMGGIAEAVHKMDRLLKYKLLERAAS
jgi:8-oxo-dGTP pyrophosphatase MutT (NUDIX family)